MKTLILTSTALAIAFTLSHSATAGAASDGLYSSAFVASSTIVEKRRPRVPGGSGCNSIKDLLEHPECRL